MPINLVAVILWTKIENKLKNHPIINAFFLSHALQIKETISERYAQIISEVESAFLGVVVSAFSCNQIDFSTNSLNHCRSECKDRKINRHSTFLLKSSEHTTRFNCVFTFLFANDDDAREYECFWQLTTLFGKCYKMLPPFRHIFSVKMYNLSGTERATAMTWPFNHPCLKHRSFHSFSTSTPAISARSGGFIENKRKCIFIQ